MPCASSSANNQNYMDNGDQFAQVKINNEVFGRLTNVILDNMCCQTLSIHYFRIRYIGRLDTWNVNWLEIESLRAELKAYNLDVTLWEFFDSHSRQEDVIRLEEGINAQPDHENVHGAEYVDQNEITLQYLFFMIYMCQYVRMKGFC